MDSEAFHGKKLMKILVADDQETVLAFFKAAFQSLNLGVELCDSGPDCLDRLRQEAFDVLFLDLIMLDMDGVEVLKIVTREFPDLQVVISSVQDDEAAIRELMLLGASAYLIKPFTAKQLGDVVRRLENKKSVTR